MNAILSAIFRYGAGALLASAAISTAGAQVRSASYGPLTLGVDGTTVTGVFSDMRIGNGTDDTPQFSCIFPLRGTFADGSLTVTVWDDQAADTITGTLTVTGDTAKLKLSANPPGCDMTGDDFAKAGFEEMSDRNGDWKSVRLVRARRAQFHAAPLESSTRKAYLVKWDVVVVYRRIGVWLDAQYYGGKRPVRGWLRESDLAPEQP